MLTKNKRRWKTGWLACTLLAAIALTACTSSGGKEKGGIGGLDKDQAGTLKIAYFDEQAFLMQYGNAFQAMFPNLTLEVVSTQSTFDAEDPAEAMEKLLEEQQPDVLFVTEEQYAKLAASGKLYDLEAAVKQDQFDLSAFVPAAIDLLKARGGGKLYGLSPSFSSQALYYNKEMFDKYGVPYPTDGMSWDDVLRLAARFPVQKDGDNAWSGLFPSSQTTDAFDLIRRIGEAKGLLYADADTGKLSIDTPEWKAIFQKVIEGYQSGSIYLPGSDAGGGKNRAMVSMRGVGGGKTFNLGPDSMKFIGGQAAMTIDSSMLMDMLGAQGTGAGGKMRVSAQASEGGEGPKGGPAPIKSFDWDMVTVPVDPSQPDVAGGFSLDGVFAINASAQNLPGAWELLKYANGEQLAKSSAKSGLTLSTRSAYKRQAEGKNVDALYALGANEQVLLQALPEEFAKSFAELASDHVKRVVGETESLDEALKAIQSGGQDLLTKAGLESEEG
ncbi:ABC transporter substrate-binding protein [Cohnella caldifontis]|uniref:ABC transporter substrate-binding protein n=1 Tax=Cohnella caldifontis TaxID=3027471 RepID=UPI0023EBF829|nr:extracellular solute-binding protein [Cohnella sp. YIM B05605]